MKTSCWECPTRRRLEKVEKANKSAVSLSTIKAHAQRIIREARAAQKIETAKDDRAYQQGIRHGAEALLNALKDG